MGIFDPMRTKWLLAWAIALEVQAARVVVIGDSLSAEYDTVLDWPGVEDPTRYAAITVPGWESLNWVEVLARLRPSSFDFGAWRESLPGWLDLRFTGYEYNFAIPGFEASQFEDIVNSSLFSNPQYLTYRGTLTDTLRNRADRVVLWLGANEFRANYGALYSGADAAPLIARLNNDLREIIRFVRRQKPSVQIVVVEIPDLGAAPAKQEAHPDPVGRARVTEATRQANTVIASLAAQEGAAVAQVASATERLIAGDRFWFGAVDLKPGADPDNNPRYTFTRDGLHPNTGMHVEIARRIIDAFNRSFGAGIANISDGEALALLGLDPAQPYLDWMAVYPTPSRGMGDDPDADGLVNFVEYAFGLNPTVRDSSPVGASIEGSLLSVVCRPDPSRGRLVGLNIEWSRDLDTWTAASPEQVTQADDGTVKVSIPTGISQAFIRLRTAVIPP
jgi:lysophospholipase L1-like esterase